MAHSKFNLDGPAFEDSTRQVMQPAHVMLLQEEEAGVDPQLFQIPPGLPAPQGEREQVADAPEDSVRKCLMEDACDPLRVFQEYEHYFFGDDSGSDCDVPEDEPTDAMEDIFSDEDRDQSSPVTIPCREGDELIAVKEGDPSSQGIHDQSSHPGNIPLEDLTAIEEDELNPENLEEEEEYTFQGDVNVQGTEPKDPTTPRRQDNSIVTNDGVKPEADQEVIPEIQLDVEVHTVTETSAAEGESSSSNLIRMDPRAGPKPRSN